MAVTVYTSRICAYCMRAKMLLKQKGIAFEEIDVSHDDEKRAWLVKTSGQRTVPQIFIDDQSIGGFQELAALNASGELDRRLAKANPA